MPNKLNSSRIEVLQHVAEHCLVGRRSEPVVCLFAGAADFWSELGSLLEANGERVLLIPVPPKLSSVESVIPRPLGNGQFYAPQIGRFTSSMLVIGLPLPELPESSAQVHEAFQRLHAERHPTVLFEWPAASVAPSLEPLVSPLYLRALSVDYEKMRLRNLDMSQRLSIGRSIRVQAPGGTDILLRRDTRPIQREDCRFSASEYLFQLPGGEVFFPPLEGSASGRIVTKIGGRKVELDVRDGWATFPDLPGVPGSAPLAEFGLGTNQEAAFLPSFSLGEKAAGTCHFGFGDNRDIGGRQEADFHFDVVVENPHITVNP